MKNQFDPQSEKTHYYILAAALTLLAMALLITTLFDTNFMLNLKLKAQNGNQVLNTDEIIDRCSSDSIYNSSDCVYKETLKFYKYNDTNAGKPETFEDLKINGGVCRDWAKYYCQIGDMMGYNTSRPIFKTNGTSSHVFCIWSNGDGYVILDQTRRYIFKFG